MPVIQNGGFQNDSEALRLFSTQFKNFQYDLFDRAASLNQAFIRLGDTWQDDQYKRLGEKINSFCATVGRFLRSTEPIPTELNKLAQKIDGFDAVR